MLYLLLPLSISLFLSFYFFPFLSLIFFSLYMYFFLSWLCLFYVFIICLINIDNIIYFKICLLEHHYKRLLFVLQYFSNSLFEMYTWINVFFVRVNKRNKKVLKEPICKLTSGCLKKTVSGIKKTTNKLKFIKKPWLSKGATSSSCPNDPRLQYLRWRAVLSLIVSLENEGDNTVLRCWSEQMADLLWKVALIWNSFKQSLLKNM